MLSSLFFTAVGLMILVVGGEVLLRGAVKLAVIFKLTPAIIGLTVVAAGTSVPELAVSIVAAWKGQIDVAVGNVVGSNIFNIAAILGLTAAYKSITVSGNAIKLEYPVMLIVTMMYVLLAADGWIGRLDALLFIIIYVSFTAYLIKIVGKQVNPVEESEFDAEIKEIGKEEDPAKWLAVTLSVVGIALLAYGADLTVKSAVEIGRYLGMSERIIGLTIVSVGTSLPEIVTSLISSYRGRNDIAIANVIGSNIFNILGILGLTAIISPVIVSDGIIGADNWWLLAITFIIFPIMRSGFQVTKKEGLFLLSFYAVYLLQLIILGG